MLQEIARSRQQELLAHPRQIALREEWETAKDLDRLQRSVRVVRAAGLPRHGELTE
ncbi:hypothetical protein [Candidatus Amarobacter glycogenicus]|uniref:hypothetical protein n=1 Tax=Candidatus Amarobacter glycogenicus TaxID=3140699 RepID=UPI002A16C781|nr:hypothetical protein [Dehalococcoidia bacterium]